MSILRMAFLATAFVAFSGLATASIIPILVTGPTGTGPFDYSYNVMLSSGDSLNPSDTAGDTCGGEPCVPPGTFFTLYDVPGVMGISAPTGWTFSTQMIGITPGGISPADGSAPNITFTYTGATITGPALFTGFNISSTSSATNPNGVYSFQDTETSNGSTENGKSFVTLPSSVVPEPQYPALIVGMFALALAGSRWLSKAAARS